MSSSGQDKSQARNRFGIGKSPITLNENYSPHKNGNNNQTYNRFIKRLLKDNQMKQGIELRIMMFYPTIGSTYFVKTQTYVALFGPHQLSIIFSGVMYLELSSL